MQRMAASILFLILLVSFGSGHHTPAFLTTTINPVTEPEDYDVSFSKYIREILENFRDQMKDGIEGIGIPPVDPLSIQNVTEDVETGYVNMLLELRDLNVTGLSKFKLNVLKADLAKGFVNISIGLPEIMVESYCYMDGKVLCILPFNSDGPFFIRMTEVNIDGYALVNVTSGGKTRVHMNDLKLSLSMRSLDIKFRSLLGGAHWAQVLLDVVSIVTPNIFRYFNEPIMSKINEVLLTLANDELDKGTLNDYLIFIPG